MKKFFYVLGSLVVVLLCAYGVFLIGVQRPKVEAETQRQIAEAARIAEEQRLEAERLEAERLAAIEAARDHRTYQIINESTGNAAVDQTIQMLLNGKMEAFASVTENSEEETMFLATRTYQSDDCYSVLVVSSYNDIQEKETFFISADSGRVENAEEAFGDSWREYLADYFKYNVKKLDRVRENLTENYKDVIANEEGNFSNFLVLEDGSAKVYFEPGTLTATDKLEIIDVPNDVLSGVYYTRRKVDPDKPMVALTFDDGPSEEYTPRILDCLEANNAVATFFEVGRLVDKYPDIVKRAADLGCEIGSHTYNHINLPSAWNSTLESDRASCEEAFTKAIGYVPTLMRPPEGAIGGSAKFMYDYTYIGWSVDTLDWLNRNSGATIYNVTKESNLDGQVILMHSIYDTSATAAEYIIPWLIEQGYQLVTISELLEYHYDIPVPEKHVYYAVDFFLYGRAAV